MLISGVKVTISGDSISVVIGHILHYRVAISQSSKSCCLLFGLHSEQAVACKKWSAPKCPCLSFIKKIKTGMVFFTSGSSLQHTTRKTIVTLLRSLGSLLATYTWYMHPTVESNSYYTGFCTYVHSCICHICTCVIASLKSL